MRVIITVAFLSALFTACSKQNSNAPQFQLLRKDATGLNFENELKPIPEFNALNYMYFYNGGGVAAGDYNNDGLTDLFFTNNMGSNRLFLNEGSKGASKLKFKDVTEAAGLLAEQLGSAPHWHSGASVTDINDDGMLDIYVSQVGDFQAVKGRNKLWVCKEIKDGIPVFAEEAIPYGLDFVGFGTQAAFFDYDLDGDLDMFQLNHSLHANGTFGQKKTFEGTQHPLAGDKLMRNDGGNTPLEGGRGVFTEVTMQAGIKSSVIGYGLGIVTGDVNNDGYPDIYIGNDFHENDYLYINQKDGTFKESLTDQIRHTSQFSMGVDIGDVNNDAWGDIISLDMHPEDPIILKSSLGDNEFGIFNFKITYGYNHQYARNTLQLNNGEPSLSGGAGGVTFSEIGMFSRTFATDWSWASLFLDFDNDGYKDLFVSNGIVHRMNDIDYVNFMANNEVHFKAFHNDLEESDLGVVEKMPKIKLPNKFLRNAVNPAVSPKGVRFDDLGSSVKDDAPTFSNGAIYADLDNDGDLDIVVNNLEDEPFIYQNLAAENKAPNRNYLSFNLKGAPGNRHAIGARVVVFKKEEKIVQEFFPVRGYQSSSLTPLHVGVGDAALVDSVFVIWPDRTFEKLPKPAFNQATSLEWKAGLPLYDFNILKKKKAQLLAFADVTTATGLNFRHKENSFVEFNRETLIPFMVSSEGPALAVGDLNGDGLEDVFFGNAKREKSALFFQKPGGTFVEKSPAAFLRDSIFEDVDAVFSDIENDGDLDIIVAAGGNEYWDSLEPMRQRYYRNDGKGNFQRIDFQGVQMTAGCVLPADFNKDGLTDYFFGARALPKNYGITPPSALLLNKGNGKFENLLATSSPDLKNAGLVKDGTWADMDADGDLDLVLAIEWEPITVFLNNPNGAGISTFEKKPVNDLTGWWNFVLPHDFDGDGDLDLLAGNHGANAKFQPDKKEPVRMYVSDFDDNGQVEQILTYYVRGKEIPFANYSDYIKALPSLKKKYLFSKDFAKATIGEIFGEEKLKKSVHREVNELRSMYFENKGNWQFEAHPLPDELQFSTLQAACVVPGAQGGKTEVLLHGNFYDCMIEMGRYDALLGNVLSIGAGGKMEVSTLGDLRIKGQVRRIEQVKVGGKTYFVFARNNEGAVVLEEVKKAGQHPGF